MRESRRSLVKYELLLLLLLLLVLLVLWPRKRKKKTSTLRQPSENEPVLLEWRRRRWL